MILMKTLVLQINTGGQTNTVHSLGHFPHHLLCDGGNNMPWCSANTAHQKLQYQWLQHCVGQKPKTQHQISCYEEKQIVVKNFLKSSRKLRSSQDHYNE